VATGAVDEVLHRGRGRLIVGAPDIAEAAAVLGQNGIAATTEGDHLTVTDTVPDPERITRMLADQGVYVSELRREEADLESVFLELTADRPEET
jgi:ABC-2 type transport system ATP-binding protein